MEKHAATRVPSSMRVLLLTVADQGASSLSNFGVALLVAHYSGARQLGVFALVSVTYIIMQGLVRSLSSDCLLTRPEIEQTEVRRYEQSGYVAAVLAATALSASLVPIALGLGGLFVGPFLVLAACFPLMAAQDYSRFVGIGRHRPGYAVVLDSAWVVAFVIFYVLLHSSNRLSLTWLLGAWTTAGALVGAATLAQHFRPLRLKPLLLFWIQSERAIAVRFSGQFLLATSGAYLVLYLLTFVVSLDAVGVIRLAQLAIGPMTVASQGLQAAMISLTAKRFRVDAAGALRFLFVIGSGTLVVTAVFTVGLYVLPVSAGTKFFGPTWPAARHVIVLVGLSYALGGLSGASNVGLRAIREASANLRLAVIMIPLTFGPCLALAAAYGSTGFAVGMVIAFGSYAVLGWRLLLRVARRRDDPVTSPSWPAQVV